MRGASSIGRSFLRTVKYNIEARLAHNSYMSTSPQGTSDGARPTTSTTTAPIAIPTAAANKQRYGQHQSTSLRAAEQQSQEARVSVSLSVSAPMGDARAFSTAATAATATSPTSASPATSPPDELHLDYHFLMWQAESQAGNAPLGTPPHRPTPAPASPCGCGDCSQIDNGNGEFVCMNCGIICGRIYATMGER